MMRIPDWCVFPAALLATLGAHGQALSPVELIAQARGVYGSAPFAERLEIEAADGTGRVERSTVEIRVDPTDVSGQSAPRTIALRLDQLRIWAGPGELIATHERDSSGWWGRTHEGQPALELLGESLPAVAFPSLAILSGMNDWTSVTPSIQWSAVTEDPSSAGWLLAGQSSGPAGEFAVQATFDRDTSRLTRLIVSGPGTVGLQRLTILAAPIEPGDVGSWRPATDEAERRSSLQALVNVHPKLVAGDRFPGIVWVRGDGRVWRLGEAVGPEGLLAPAPGTTVLILFRAPSEPSVAGPILADARAGAHTSAERVRQRSRESIAAGGKGVAPLSIVLGAVFALDAFDAERFTAIEREVGDLGSADPGVVWTSPAGATMDAMSPEASAILCVVGADGLIDAIVVLDGMADAPESAGADVARAIDRAIDDASASPK